MIGRLTLLMILMAEATLYGRNQSEPIYVEPFDRGAGGTVLTRASREGIILGNPALLNLGKAWIRWAGLQITMKAKGDINKVQEGIQTAESAEGNIDPDILEAVDLGFGPEFTLAVLTKNGGGALFADVATYFRYDSFGNTGIPGARASLEAAGGLAVAAAINPVRWLSIGATQKQLYGVYKDITVTPLNSTEALAELQNVDGLGTGSGTDLGAIIFLQGFTIDYSLGLTMSNLTPVKFTNDAYPTLVPMKNVGLGFAIHTGSSVIDLSAELHDVEAKSGESLSRRLHLGSRFLVWGKVGVAAGYMNGGPSFGLAFDLILLKMTLSYSNRVIGFGSTSFIRPEATLTTTLGF